MKKKTPYKKIHVTFDDETMEILEIISEKEKRPLSEVVRRMTEDWMKRYEDRHWADLSDEDLSGPAISHEEVWKNV